MNHRWIIGVTSISALLVGCFTTYQPLKVDPKTALYPTTVEVDPGGVQTFVTTIDPRSFSAVLLLTEANYRPSLFTFMIRDALAQVSITNVYTSDEFKQLALDHGFTTSERLDSDTIKRNSDTIAPVLVVSASHVNEGDAHTVTDLTIQDGRSGQILLRVNHLRTVWWSFDDEAIYPVLNQLRRWVSASKPGAT